MKGRLIFDIDNPQSKLSLRCRKYIELLKQWSTVTDLMSESGLEHVWTRHIIDCLPLLDLAPSANRWLDVGSGAGFPGIVVAIALADLPEAEVHLVESDGRKCAFLREVGRALKLPIHVHRRRIETLTPAEVWPIDVITARAFASLADTLLALAPYLQKGSLALLLRGQTAVHELDAVSHSCYAAECLPNPAGGGGFILAVKMAHHSEGHD